MSVCNGNVCHYMFVWVLVVCLVVLFRQVCLKVGIVVLQDQGQRLPRYWIPLNDVGYVLVSVQMT